MVYAAVFHMIGWLLCILASAMLLPALAAGGSGDWETTIIFTLCALITAFVGGAFVLALRGWQRQTADREGILLVGAAWIILPIFASLPLAASDGFPTLLDAWFEAVSGMTTTGATIIEDYAVPSIPIYIWRATLQWLGGLATIISAIHILTAWSSSSLPVLRPKQPTVALDIDRNDLFARIKQTAPGIAGIYAAITFVGFLGLWLSDIPAWEALSLAGASISTGGFTTRAGSITQYELGAGLFLVIVLMFIGGTSFLLHTQLLRRRFLQYVQDLEFFHVTAFIGVIGIFFLIAQSTATYEMKPLQAIFNATSLTTTTGFYFEDISNKRLPNVTWLVPILIGASVASTSGGFKLMRLVLLMQHGWQEMKRLSHPHSITSFRYNKRIVSNRTMAGVWGLLIAVICLIAITALFVGLAGYDYTIAVATATAVTTNTGPVLLAATGGEVTYAEFPPLLRTLLAFSMILGRVELLLFLVLFNGSFWRF